MWGGEAAVCAFQLFGIWGVRLGTVAAAWRVVEGPRERLGRFGSGALADVELLAVLLGTGRAGEDVGALAARLLGSSGGLWGLSRMSPAELARLVGIGPAKAARLAAAFELGARASDAPAGAVPKPLANSEAVFRRYGRALMRSRIERFVVISVDAKNRAQADHEVARGGRTRCQVDPSEVFRTLISESASGAIFVHNHPSGDPQPSPQDLDLTERLVSAGALLEIRVLDHLIIGRGAYVSLRDAGLWPKPIAKSRA